MTLNLDPSTATEVVQVTLDPRRAYQGYGPDVGPIAEAARMFDDTEAQESLLDAAEQLDFTYLRAWKAAAERIAPDITWQVSAPAHRSISEVPLQHTIAQVAPGSAIGEELIDRINAALRVDVQTLDFGGTRWRVIDGHRVVGSSTVMHSVASVQDQHVADVAGEIREECEPLRKVEYDGLRLELFDTSGVPGATPGTLAYILTDHERLVFADTDFTPSPLHAIDSDRTVEALAEFLAQRPGDTDAEYFANHTERQLLWSRGGDGPARLYELIAELPGDTEYRSQMAMDAEYAAERSGEIGAWHVKPLDRTDLPAVDLLADTAANARAQYPAYVSAWSADTRRELDIDGDLFPALSAERSSDAIHEGRPVVSVVRGQATLDWAVEHVNYWQADAYIATGLIRSDTTLDIPATGTATVAIRNAAATAHAGARVEAHNRSRIVALTDSEVQVHPGAAVNRTPGSHVALAPQTRMGRPTSAFRDAPARGRALGL